MKEASQINSKPKTQNQKEDPQNVKKIFIKTVKFVIWLGGLYGSCFIHIQKFYFIVSIFYFIFTNLGKRKQGEMSAYSVFNKDFKKLPGTFSAEQMFKGKVASKKFEQRQDKLMDEDQIEKAKSINEYFKNLSKYGNKPCYCGSQVKFKKCCLVKKKLEEEEQRKQRLNEPKDS